MSQVREIIELLTRVMRGNGASKIKAEIFRLAKFDKDEAVVPLWRLLFELLYFLDHGTIDEVAIKACTELTPEEHVVYVKRGMQQRGFYSRAFSHLPNNMSSGSRELLLALAWLVCTERLVDKFMEKCASPLDDDMPESSIGMTVSRAVDQSSETSKLTPLQKVHQLQLLNGKLHLSLKHLYALQRQWTKLQHRVHESTQGVSLIPEHGHLSVLEVYLLRHPDHMKKLLKLLEKDNTRLQNLVSWKENEQVFWKWMESVLELKMNESEQQTTPRPMVHYNIPPDIVGRVQSARSQLEAAILKYEPIIEQLEELWEKKQTSISNEDLNCLLSSIETELAIHKASIQSDKTVPIFHNEPRLLYLKNTSNKKSGNIQPANKLAEHTDGSYTDIQTEISALESHIRMLELETRRKERMYRGELDELAAKIPDSTCILPSSLT